MRALEFLTGHVIFQLHCNQIYQLKTTLYLYHWFINKHKHYFQTSTASSKGQEAIISCSLSRPIHSKGRPNAPSKA